MIRAGAPKESVIQNKTLPIHIIEKPPQQPPTKKLLIKIIHQEATPPLRATDGSAGYGIFSCEETTVEPRQQQIVNAGFSMTLPTGTYGRIAPQSGLTVTNKVTVMAGVIYLDYTEEVKVVTIDKTTLSYHPE